MLSLCSQCRSSGSRFSVAQQRHKYPHRSPCSEGSCFTSPPLKTHPPGGAHKDLSSSGGPQRAHLGGHEWQGMGEGVGENKYNLILVSETFTLQNIASNTHELQRELLVLPTGTPTLWTTRMPPDPEAWLTASPDYGTLRDTWLRKTFQTHQQAVPSLRTVKCGYSSLLHHQAERLMGRTAFQF